MFMLRVSPNPSTSQVRFELAETSTKSELVIYNLSGNVIWHKQIDESSFMWNAEHLPRGMYLYALRNTSSGEVTSGKIILQ